MEAPPAPGLCIDEWSSPPGGAPGYVKIQEQDFLAINPVFRGGIPS